jgi:hypothetical protein
MLIYRFSMCKDKNNFLNKANFLLKNNKKILKKENRTKILPTMVANMDNLCKFVAGALRRLKV